MEELISEKLKNDLYDIVCYLLTCSSTYIEEPRNYVPIRLLEVSSRILNIINSEEYILLAEELDKLKNIPLRSEEQYLEKIEKLLLKLI